jgi:hypothetical protein
MAHARAQNTYAQPAGRPCRRNVRPGDCGKAGTARTNRTAHDPCAVAGPTPRVLPAASGTTPDLPASPPRLYRSQGALT